MKSLKMTKLFCAMTLALGTLPVIAATVAAPATTLKISGPTNLGGGLREILGHQTTTAPTVTTHALTPLSETGTTKTATSTKSPLSSLARTDAQGRYLVHVYLKSFSGAAKVVADLNAKGAAVKATSSRVKNGAIAAYIPITQAGAIAANTNVKAVTLALKPHTNVGLVTSEGAAALHTQLLNLKGITGKGITIGVMSDSFDTSGNPINAAADVASGDLPGAGNPLGHTTPVYVLAEGPANSTDEGRGMLQIVHDLAPDARLCFATAYDTDLTFASNIVSLADPAQGCGANIIVDDVYYFDEPVFSDGPIAMAVNTVAAAGIPYFSSAGNNNQNAYEADFRPVADSVARAGLGNNNLHLEQVPEILTAGGFHNFAGATGTQIAMPISAAADDYLFLQWNDPFYQGAVTADYALLIFDDQGNFLGDNSTFDNTFLTDQPIQYGIVNGPSSTSSGNYQVVLAKMNTNSSAATRMHLDFELGNTAALAFKDEYVPTTHGHASAAGAIGVAADYWGDTKSIEYFSSLGPTRIYFDSESNRLATPILRKKPDIAAVDGVSTTFFGGNYGGAYPQFFGTSAAAPHAAGVAALMMQVAGGPGSISGAVTRNIMQASSHKHDLQPGYIEGRNQAAGLAVRMTGTGYIRLDPTKFTLSFTDTMNKGRKLTGFHLDLSPAGLFVRGSFAVSSFGPLAQTDLSVLTKTFPSNTLDLSFANSTFTSGGQIAFGFRFNEASIGNLGRNVDLLAGSTFAATFSDGSVVNGTFANVLGTGYAVDQGFGLIDAEAAAAVISPAFLAAPVRVGGQ